MGYQSSTLSYGLLKHEIWSSPYNYIQTIENNSVKFEVSDETSHFIRTDNLLSKELFFYHPSPFMK